MMQGIISCRWESGFGKGFSIHRENGVPGESGKVLEAAGLTLVPGPSGFGWQIIRVEQ